MIVKRPFSAWLLWWVLTLAAGLALARPFLGEGGDKSWFLPGPSSHGHYQIELQCGACHSEPFAAETSLQAACERCHARELEEANDAHPKAKFTDPRNASRVAALDARRCTTCHREHRPETTQRMGLTLPVDYCVRCHQEIADERPSHRELGFQTCAVSGCHNFHDNRALYEDFLVSRVGEPDVHGLPRRPLGSLLPQGAMEASNPGAALGAVDADWPAAWGPVEDFVSEWATSRHAAGGVNCSGCHRSGEGSGGDWVKRPSLQVCGDCHRGEQEGWLAGRHGMRVAQGLPAMKPKLARSPMHAAVADRELDCGSCHRSHSVDVRAAASTACLDCHADEHSLAYSASIHAELWRRELTGEGEAGSGVACATCHMPRLASEGGSRVEHNQNNNLRPNEKMLREVCLNCHGLAFALDALADPELIRRNFAGRPSAHVASVDMARVRARNN